MTDLMPPLLFMYHFRHCLRLHLTSLLMGAYMNFMVSLPEYPQGSRT